MLILIFVPFNGKCPKISYFLCYWTLAIANLIDWYVEALTAHGITIYRWLSWIRSSL